jgi:hypothetical protein
MGHDDGRHPERQHRVRIPIDVHEVGTDPSRQFEEPAAGAGDVDVGIGHPLQPERPMDEGEMRMREQLARARHRRRRAGDRDGEADPARRERIDQRLRVGPDAAHGIGRHQHV